MGIITKDRLRTIAESSIGTRTFSQVINESKAEKRNLTTTSVFLSHSHTDKVEVDRAVAFFRTLGIRIYVDWLDSTMPPTTSGETAERIKQAIKRNDKFVLLATDAAIRSKWCNWELGYGDAHKYINKIALLPISENSYTGWTGNEYLNIYPRIEENTVRRGSFDVIFPEGKTQALPDWLRAL